MFQLLSNSLATRNTGAMPFFISTAKCRIDESRPPPPSSTSSASYLKVYLTMGLRWTFWPASCKREEPNRRVAIFESSRGQSNANFTERPFKLLLLSLIDLHVENRSVAMATVAKNRPICAVGTATMDLEGQRFGILARTRRAWILRRVDVLYS
ncbi:unnamed protein product [Nesidiocoris tenuis]|uniref:Uncharacterized protein n=1 Tax=Nesidiocoris tenuis TaxID=355587 RepID=A0A6H5FUP7_9HEMI|nr:unnamed protein product [Nesidiocoris tenuis]